MRNGKAHVVQFANLAPHRGYDRKIKHLKWKSSKPHLKRNGVTPVHITDENLEVK